MSQQTESQLILDAINRIKELSKENTLPGLALCAVDTLNFVLTKTKAKTHHELNKELNLTISHIQRIYPTSLTLKCSCELYMHFIHHTTFSDDFSVSLQLLRRNGNLLYERLLSCRDRIIQNSISFIKPSVTILTHGFSMVICGILLAKRNVSFKLIVTEGRPFGYGKKTIQYLKDKGATFEIEEIIDSAVAYKMKEVDLVLVGSQTVVKTGGSINSLGTYNIAIIAKHYNIPLYVAAECFKFSDRYPIEQTDANANIPQTELQGIKTILYDYTPPEMISLVLSDLAVFTPSAVADELIKLYGMG
ncbi:Translation initiation factor eIF2B subunit alpha [Entamoeba marina]